HPAGDHGEESIVASGSGLRNVGRSGCEVCVGEDSEQSFAAFGCNPIMFTVRTGFENTARALKSFEKELPVGIGKARCRTSFDQTRRARLHMVIARAGLEIRRDMVCAHRKNN